MEYLVKLKEIDSLLIERNLDNFGDGPSSLEVIVDGRAIFIDPRKILRILVRGNFLDELMDEDADVTGLLEAYKGELKGGPMRKRDKRFGLSKDFWDWWHRMAKAKNGGKDIETKKEADEWHDVYIRSKSFVQDSLIYKSIHLLSTRERPFARYSIWIIAILMAQAKIK